MANENAFEEELDDLLTKHKADGHDKLMGILQLAIQKLVDETFNNAEGN